MEQDDKVSAAALSFGSTSGPVRMSRANGARETGRESVIAEVVKGETATTLETPKGSVDARDSARERSEDARDSVRERSEGARDSAREQSGKAGDSAREPSSDVPASELSDDAADASRPAATDDSKTPKKTKNNVRKIRIERMMSKAELARRANLSVLTIDRVERGYGCRVDTKRKILEALGLSLADRVRVFGEEE
jgi:DNA-binding XRE family transcriptional regulator